MSLAALQGAGYEIEARNHALAVLTQDFPDEVNTLCNVLLGFDIRAEELIRGGGGESPATQRLRHDLDDKGWKKRNVRTRKTINGNERRSETHEIDHFRSAENGGIALEIEWNNKDTFFNRDLDNFRQLHADGEVSVGIVITRGASLQRDLVQIVNKSARKRGCQAFGDLKREFGYVPTERQEREVNKRAQKEGDFIKGWARAFVADKYAASTTHWTKLAGLVDRGVGGPCPLLLIGIPSGIVTVS